MRCLVSTGSSREPLSSRETVVTETPVAAEPIPVQAAPPTPAPAPTPPPPSVADDPTATLERLAALRDRGLITADEYDAKKREILERI